MAIFNGMSGLEFDAITYSNFAITFFIGLITSHLYRNFIIRFNWLKFKLPVLIPLVILASAILASIFFISHTYISDVIILGESISFDPLDVLFQLINLSALFILWTLLYWSFHFIQNYRKEEIKNLKWQATINEMELNKIKSQLNPHFIFNSMNSIRALVDENPIKAKNAITQLSNILRSSLYLERKPTIPFEEELSLVRDYLELEKARLEERLDYNIELGEKCGEFNVPPLLVQTLVENGIKHGISKLERGGKLLLKASCEGDVLHILIKNTGSFTENRNGRKGIGLKISHERLKLLYGENANLSIEEKEGSVEAALTIPKEREKKKEYESIDR